MLEGIPEFPEFRPIRLGDRPVLESFFAEHPSEVSERTFGSIYVWRNYAGRSQLSRIDGHLLASWYREKWGKVLFSPTGPDPAAVIEQFASADPGRRIFGGVFGIVEPVVSGLRERGLDPLPLRDEWDYVYLVEDLVRLEGAKYHSLRKEMAKATGQYSLEYAPMTPEHRKACLDLEAVWCDLKHCTIDRFSAAEDLALKEALEGFEEMGFFGGVVLLDGKVQALSVGERLTEDTAVVHFEKANPEIRGLYQVISQRFSENALRGFKFVNREQDVGEPGLRRAKEGYHPHHFVEKHLLMF